jgi:ADP-ribose pyrophosphatase YjhB (NUDIX family)
MLRGRQCISLAGAWKNSWEAISPPQREVIAAMLTQLFLELDPAETVLITGGTQHGVEGLAHRVVCPMGIPVLAAIVNETPPQSLAPGEFTHAYLVGARLYDKVAGLYSLLRRHNGLTLFIGGGPIVNDEIQAAANLRVRYLLMEGPEGASTEHAREQPHRSFRTADEVLAVLRGEGPWRSVEPPYWHLGANPTVDIVLVRPGPSGGEEEVLLIQRDPDAPTEPGKWALPGGFVHTHAPPDTPWTAGAETERVACLRELWEETGLDLRGREEELLPVGEYEGGGRDPRDTPERWSRTVVFALRLVQHHPHVMLAGGDDASDARWLPLSTVPPDLAFDHERLLRDALIMLRRADR